jgi:hypothetical protein
MKSATIAGIFLIILGIFSLAYQGITFTTQKKVADVGPIHATRDQKHTIPLTPVLGGLLLAFPVQASAASCAEADGHSRECKMTIVRPPEMTGCCTKSLATRGML